MILSVHLAHVGPPAELRCLSRTPTADDSPGLRYASVTLVAALGGPLLPLVQPGRVRLVAAWEDDAALDRFLESHPLAERMRSGWHVRLEPLRAVGEWSALPELEQSHGRADDGEPVAAVTLGRLRPSQGLRFFRASTPAERAAVSHPGVVLSAGLARPPRLVATFSLWRTVAEMRDYAYGANGAPHPAASSAHKQRPFHSESIFGRFRPYRSAGSWEGRDPLAAAAARPDVSVAAGG